MRRVLIIEDEDIAAARLKAMLLRIDPELIIEGPLESVSQSIEYLNRTPQPDLLFLDIQLSDGMSFSIFEKVKISAPIIFTTAYDEFAIKAFELNSLDYLLKPIDEQRLRASFEKLGAIKEYYSTNKDFQNLKELIGSIRRETSYKSRFLVSKGDTLLPINADEVAYFIAEEKVVMLVTFENKKHIINFTLDSLDEKLNPQHFFRINRHCILNHKAIVKVHNYFNYKLKVDLNPGYSSEIIVSKARVADFKEWLNN